MSKKALIPSPVIVSMTVVIVIIFIAIGIVLLTKFGKNINSIISSNQQDQSEVANIAPNTYQNQEFDGTIYFGPEIITNKSKDLKTFHGDWFTFDFPKSWKLDGNDSSGTGLYKLSERDRVSILVMTNYNPQTFLIDNQEPAMLDNVNAMKYSGYSNGTYYKSVDAKYGTLYFTVSITSRNESLLDKYEPVFTDVLSSFKFSDFAIKNLK